jgi:hypothetical protein
LGEGAGNSVGVGQLGELEVGVVEIQAREATAGIDLGHHSLIVAGGGQSYR